MQFVVEPGGLFRFGIGHANPSISAKTSRMDATNLLDQPALR
jgi:hypothetical protein